MKRPKGFFLTNNQFPPGPTNFDGWVVTFHALSDRLSQFSTFTDKYKKLDLVEPILLMLDVFCPFSPFLIIRILYFACSNCFLQRLRFYRPQFEQNLVSRKYLIIDHSNLFPEVNQQYSGR